MHRYYYWGKEGTHKNEALLKVKEEFCTNESLLKLDGALHEEELERSKIECAKLKEEIVMLNMQGRALNEITKIREEIFVKEQEELKMKIARSIEDQTRLDEEKIRMEEHYAELNARYLKLEEKLRRSQWEHDKSKEEITSLIEDHIQEKKQIEEHYAKNYNERLKETKEKDEMILHLNEKINELVNQKLESALNERVKIREGIYVKKHEDLKKKISKSIEDQRKLGEEKIRIEECYAELNAQYLKLEEKLRRSQREHNKSKEEIIRLIDDQRGEKKRMEERYAKDDEKYLKKTEEKDEIILELNKKIEELENQKLESEHTVEIYMQNVKSSDLMVAQMNGELEELKREKAEADKNLEEYRQRFETLNARVRMSEQDLVNVLNVSVNDLTNQGDKLEKKSAAAEEGAMHVSGSGCENESSVDGRRRENDDPRNQDLDHFQDESKLKNGTTADGPSPMVVSARPTSGNEMNRGGQRAIDTIIDHNEPIKEHLEPAGCSREMAKSLECVDIIEIADSDDEATEQEGSLVSSTSKRKKSTNGNENNETFLIGVQKEKRRRELMSDGPESFINESFLKSIPVAIDQPFHGIASSDSDDDSISSSHIDALIASC